MDKFSKNKQMQLPKRKSLYILSFVRTGAEPHVWDHWGMLGPRRRGSTVCRLCRGAHRPDLQDNRQHYLRQPHLFSHVSHQRGPTSQRVQHLNGWHHLSPELLTFYFSNPNSADFREYLKKHIYKKTKEKQQQKNTSSNLNAAAILSQYWYFFPVF